MRSCYDAVDDLNFVPMDQFQIDFFLLRQNEWEKYLDENDCKQVLSPYSLLPSKLGGESLFPPPSSLLPPPSSLPSF